MDSLRTLAIDVGGTGIKMLVLDPSGQPISERTRVRTPRPADPASVIEAIAQMLPSHPPFDRVSVGFPGVVIDGIIHNAPNLDGDWSEVDLAGRLRHRTGREVRVVNDADMQGLGAIEGRGVEFVCTLGTGFGSALFVEGRLVPNLELGHHPLRGKQTYEDLLGKASYKKIGKEAWNEELIRALEQIRRTFNPRTIYVGGGRAKKIRRALPAGVVVVSNLAGLLGGIRLWT